MKNGWREPVGNQDIITALCDLVDTREGDTYFTMVKGHSRDHGNDMADELAKEGTLK